MQRSFGDVQKDKISMSRGLSPYDKNATDFRDPVKNILGIKFTREREDEAAIVNDIAALEKNKNIKRLQNLQPQVDFDWVLYQVYQGKLFKSYRILIILMLLILLMLECLVGDQNDDE